MKRFITYLYQYEQGAKSINTGFVRVDIRKDKVRMEIHVQNLGHFQEPGEICGLVYRNEMLGVSLGNMRIINGQGNKTLEFEVVNVADSEISFEEFIGISIDFSNKGFLATCWKDAFADIIGKSQIQIRPWIPEQLLEEEIQGTENTRIQIEPCNEEVHTDEIHTNAANFASVLKPDPEEKCISTYKKIDLAQIHSLPTKNWHLSTNSFLIHGFWNYGYLVLQKKTSGDKEETWLGVPGIYEKPEMLMAVLFGFPDFEALPTEIKAMQMEAQVESFAEQKENQEPEVGTFGAWFVKLEE